MLKGGPTNPAKNNTFHESRQSVRGACCVRYRREAGRPNPISLVKHQSGGEVAAPRTHSELRHHISSSYEQRNNLGDQGSWIHSTTSLSTAPIADRNSCSAKTSRPFTQSVASRTSRSAARTAATSGRRRATETAAAVAVSVRW